jgi:O-acetylhomoserine (thiol)-lyase
MADRKFGFETLCLHAGQIPDPATGARAAPIYQTTSFVFDSAEHAASLFNLQTFGNVYSRISNPTVAVLEERMAAVENGRAGLACATGQAAEATAILTLCRGGDHIVSASTLYGGTHTLLGVNLQKLGIETTFVDPDDLNSFRTNIRKNTKLIYAETLGNPLINVVDIEALAKIAREAQIPLVVDNTVPSPYLCRPIDWGADIVVHSATKYIGGHGYTMKARMEIMRTFGPALSPMNAWLLLQGLESLPLRMDRHCANALAVAKFLRDHPRVAWVNYPGLPDSKYYKLAQKYFPKGASGLLNFGVKGGAKAGEKFIDAAQFMSHLANIGDAKTLVIHPASTTHRQMSDEDQLKAGVKPDMVRMSVGIESIDDILWDIDQALEASGK